MSANKSRFHPVVLEKAFVVCLMHDLLLARRALTFMIYLSTKMLKLLFHKNNDAAHRVIIPRP